MYSADEAKKTILIIRTILFGRLFFNRLAGLPRLLFQNRDDTTMVMAASGAVLSKDGGKKRDFLRRHGNYAMHGDLQQAKIVGSDVWLVYNAADRNGVVTINTTSLPVNKTTMVLIR